MLCFSGWYVNSTNSALEFGRSARTSLTLGGRRPQRLQMVHFVYRGYTPGLYSEYDLGNLQLRHFSNGRLHGFLDEADAVQAEAQRVSKCARHTQDILLAADTRVISLYTDGSHSKPHDKCGLPDLAGWGFFALERTTAITLHEQYDRVRCKIADSAYHGAATSSNNTGETP